MARGILSLTLQTRDIAALRLFYTQTLGLSLTRDEAGTITIAAGSTELTFIETNQNSAPQQGGNPIYHFAFNIPENRLNEAFEWLRPRTPLHREPDGSEIYDFQSWNAHAVYFFDPAGNILEFIARHSLNNAAPVRTHQVGDPPWRASGGPESREVAAFKSTDILYASEIGIVVDDVAEAVRAAHRDWGLHVFGGSQSDDFAAVGTDEALLIIAKRGRPWFGGEGAVADVFETSAEFSGDRIATLKIADLPYALKMIDARSPYTATQ